MRMFIYNNFFKRINDCVWIFLFTVFSILVRGYEYGIGNQVHYLTYLNYALNPSLYPHDFLLKTHAIPYTIFMEILKFMPTVEGSLQVTIFLVYLILLYSFYLGIFKISQNIFKDKKTSWLALFLLLYPIPIGGSTIVTVEKILIPRFVADVFLIVSVYFLTFKKITRSAIFAAIGFLFHPLTMLPYPIILIFLGLYKNISRKKIILGFGVFLAVIAPLLNKFFTHDVKVTPFIDSAWKAVLLERMPYIFILRWFPLDFVLIAFIPLFFIFFSRISGVKTKIHPVVKAAVFASLGLFAISILSDIFSYRLGLQLQLGRNLFLLIIFSLLYIARLIVTRFKEISIFYLCILAFIISLVFMLPTRFQDGILWFRPISDYEKTALWVRQNTPLDSIFLVDPTKEGFRLWSRRSVVVEYKEGGDSLYDRSFGMEWDRRQDLLEGYKLDSQKITSLQKEFQINYIVTTQILHEPLVYKAGNWMVYKVK